MRLRYLSLTTEPAMSHGPRVSGCSAVGGREQTVHMSEPTEHQQAGQVQRNLTLTAIELYAAKKLLDVAVPDAYQAAKGRHQGGRRQDHGQG